MSAYSAYPTYKSAAWLTGMGLDESEGDGDWGAASPPSTALLSLGLTAPKLTISGYPHWRTQSKCCHLAFQAD